MESRTMCAPLLWASDRLQPAENPAGSGAGGDSDAESVPRSDSESGTGRSALRDRGGAEGKDR